MISPGESTRERALALGQRRSPDRPGGGVVLPVPPERALGPSPARRRGRTLLEIAKAIRMPADLVHCVLADEARRGNVVCVGGEWAATQKLEQMHGTALRGLAPIESEED